MRIGVMGLRGSFTEMASLQYKETQGIADAELVYLEVAERVMQAIEEGKIDIGVIPLYNSTMGMVESSLRPIVAHTAELVTIFRMKIEPCMMVLPGTKKEAITQIVSMEPALLQCGKYFAATFPGIPTVPYADTGKAAQDLAQGVLDKTSAIVAPATAAEAYGLEIFEKGIHDDKANTTTFVVLKGM